MISIQLVIINHRTGEPKAVIDGTRVLSLRYSRELNGVGKLALTMPYDRTLYNAYALDDFIAVSTNYTGSLVEEENYLLRVRRRYYEGGQEYMAFGAVSLNHLIMRRLVVPTAPDIANAGGFSTKAGNAVSVLAAYAAEQLITPSDTSRAIPRLTITTSGAGNPVGARERFSLLWDLFIKLSDLGDIDFNVSRTTGRDMELFIGRIGTDKTYASNYPVSQAVVLSVTQGTLLDPTLDEIRDSEKNYVYALGEGEGSNQVVLPYPGDGVIDSLFNRIEFVASNRKGQTDTTSAAAELFTRAIEAVVDNQFKVGFSGIPALNNRTLQFGVDYVLGDTITAQWGDVSYDVRVTGVETNVSTPNSFERTLTMEQDI